MDIKKACEAYDKNRIDYCLEGVISCQLKELPVFESELITWCMGWITEMNGHDPPAFM